MLRYLVTNRMESDLNNYLRRDTLQEAQISFFTYQIFRALKYLHSSKIIHRVNFYNTLIKSTRSRLFNSYTSRVKIFEYVLCLSDQSCLKRVSTVP